jgi:hypothetical protein
MNWDNDVPFEIEIRTNWAEELLDDRGRGSGGGVKVKRRKIEGELESKEERDEVKERGDKCEEKEGVSDEKEEEEEEEESDLKWKMKKENVLPDKEVFLLSPCFSPEECLKIIAAAEAKGFGRTNYPKHYRGNYRLITTDINLASVLWSRMQDLVPAEVEENGCTWDAIGLNECFRLSKYCDGDVFSSHVDTFYRRNSEEKSMYTVNIYLNGSGTCNLELNCSVNYYYDNCFVRFMYIDFA